MKKLIVFLLGLSVSATFLSCSGGKDAEKMREDSIRRADSLAAVAAAEAAAAEQARLDSIRQDSINFEEKMRLGTLEFVSHDGQWTKILPKYGFELVKKKKYQYEEYEDQIDDWIDYVYSRDINGRKTNFEFSVCISCGNNEYDAKMTILDDEERRQFIEDIKKLGSSDGNSLYFDKKRYHWVSVNGKDINFSREH